MRNSANVIANLFRSSIMRLSILLLTLCLIPSYTFSQEDTKTSSDTTLRTQDVELTYDLLLILYKQDLRLDSCEADAKVMDSMRVQLERILFETEITKDVLKEKIKNLNGMLHNYKIKVSNKEKEIKIVRKKSFWKGFWWGSGSTVATLTVIAVIIL